MRTLPLLDDLEAALASGTNTRRIEMLTRVTDLFVGGAPRFSETQIGVFDDVMVRLVNTIEAKARARLSHRLAPIANAPTKVVGMLAFDDDIDVAQPVLSQSERLGDRELLASAASKSQQHLAAIAQRKSLSEAVTCKPEQCSATLEYPGPDGTFTVSLRYFDLNNVHFKLLAGDRVIAQRTAGPHAGFRPPVINGSSSDRVVVPGVTLHKGENIRVEGNAPLDYIEILPETRQ